MTMDNDLVEKRQLRDAAVVRAVRAEMNRSLADLAVRPLDEAVGERMRSLLDTRAPMARAALRRLDSSVEDPGVTDGSDVA